MYIKIELSTKDVRGLIIDELARRLGDTPVNADNVIIEVKSKQNYKSEWESAEYRVSYQGNI